MDKQYIKAKVGTVPAMIRIPSNQRIEKGKKVTFYQLSYPGSERKREGIVDFVSADGVLFISLI